MVVYDTSTQPCPSKCGQPVLPVSAAPPAMSGGFNGSDRRLGNGLINDQYQVSDTNTPNSDLIRQRRSSQLLVNCRHAVLSILTMDVSSG